MKHNISFPFNRCSIRVCFLAFLWINCLLLGIYFASKDLPFVSLMHFATYSRVSIVGLAVVLFLPLLILVPALHFRRLSIIYIYSAIKAYCAGYMLYGISFIYYNASWLVRLLLLFSDTGITVLFFGLLLQYLNGTSANFKADIFCCCIATVAIGITDYLLVTPFLMSLMAFV